MTQLELLSTFGAIIVTAMLSGALTWSIRPILVRYMPARPNARSSHSVATPQGAGIAVVTSAVLVAAIAATLVSPGALNDIWLLLSAAIFLGVIGAIDDLRSIPVAPRLALQSLAVGMVLWSIPDNLRIFDAFPFWIERGFLLFAGVWFVNLVNFMDGLDWMTVAEAVPVSGAIVLLGISGEQSFSATLVAAALGGAMIGFAPFNRPVAKVFLGDVGSLPTGLLLGWCLLQLAYHHHVTAALLLPLYYLVDTTITLVNRLVSGKAFWQAHREHFYQKATDNGWTVLQVVTCVFSTNIFLAVLAWLSVQLRSDLANAGLLALGVVATAIMLTRFSMQRA